MAAMTKVPESQAIKDKINQLTQQLDSTRAEVETATNAATELLSRDPAKAKQESVNAAGLRDFAGTIQREIEKLETDLRAAQEAEREAQAAAKQAEHQAEASKLEAELEKRLKVFFDSWNNVMELDDPRHRNQATNGAIAIYAATRGDFHHCGNEKTLRAIPISDETQAKIFDKMRRIISAASI